MHGITQRPPAAMAAKAADPFKGAVQMLRAAVESEKKAQAGDADARPEAVRLYTEANVLLDQALAKGSYPEKVMGIITQKKADVTKRLAKLEKPAQAPTAGVGASAAPKPKARGGPPPSGQMGGVVLGAPGKKAPPAMGKKGPPPMPGAAAPATEKKPAGAADPVKHAVSLLKAASAEDTLLKGDDQSKLPEALRLYKDASAALGVALASGATTAKTKEALGKKDKVVAKRIKMLEDDAAKASAGDAAPAAAAAAEGTGKAEGEQEQGYATVDLTAEVLVFSHCPHTHTTHPPHTCTLT